MLYFGYYVLLCYIIVCEVLRYYMMLLYDILLYILLYSIIIYCTILYVIILYYVMLYYIIYNYILFIIFYNMHFHSDMRNDLFFLKLIVLVIYIYHSLCLLFGIVKFYYMSCYAVIPDSVL